jgi:ribosomal protein S18 acetylase RimI-like enzyme
MTIRETALNDTVLAELIRMSEDWEAENSCYGYRANERSDIEGNRIFLAEESGNIVGYLFGSVRESKNMKSVMPEGTSIFELEEIYVVPGRRSQGIGEKLFRYAENAVRTDAEYIVLSTATKNRKAIFHFYIDELGMEFWSARLFKKIRP